MERRLKCGCNVCRTGKGGWYFLRFCNKHEQERPNKDIDRVGWLRYTPDYPGCPVAGSNVHWGYDIPDEDFEEFSQLKIEGKQSVLDLF
jgi:hypothetical protein